MESLILLTRPVTLLANPVYVKLIHITGNHRARPSPCRFKSLLTVETPWRSYQPFARIFFFGLRAPQPFEYTPAILPGRHGSCIAESVSISGRALR